MEQQTIQKINKDMLIGDVLEKNPTKSAALANVMLSYGLHCVGCHASTMETLEQGIVGHGLTEKDLNDMLSELNAIIAEEKVEVSEPKFGLTDTAANKIKDLQQKENLEGQGLKINVIPGGCAGYSYDFEFQEKAADNELTFTEHGISVFIAKDHMLMLQGSELDYFDGLKGSGFKLNNPNAKKACGCGTSVGF